MKLALLIVEGLSLLIACVGCDGVGSSEPQNMTAVAAVSGALASMSSTDVLPSPDAPRCGGTKWVTHGDGNKTPCPGCVDCEGKGDAASEPAKGCPCGPNCACAKGFNPDCKCPKCPKCDRCACQCECDKADKPETLLWPDQPLTAADLDKMIAEAPDEKWRETFKKMRANWFNQDGTPKEDDAPETPFTDTIGAGVEVNPNRVVCICSPDACLPCDKWRESVVPAMKATAWTDWHVQTYTWGDPETYGMMQPLGYPAYYRYQDGMLADVHIGLLDGFQIRDFYDGKPIGTFAAARRPVQSSGSSYCRSCR